MRLVETHNVPIHLCQFFLHLRHESVSGEHHIASRCFLKHLLAVIGMIEQHDVERWGKACQLAFPVGDNGSGRYNQRWSQFRLIQQEGDGLHRLTEPHIVRQASASSPMVEAHHPAEAFVLIIAQCGVQRVGYLGVERCRLLNLLEQRFILLVDAEVFGLRLYDFCKTTNIECRHAHLSLSELRHAFEALHLLAHFLGEGEVGRIVQFHILAHHASCGNEREQLMNINAGGVRDLHLALCFKPSSIALQRDVTSRGYAFHFQFCALSPLRDKCVFMSSQPLYHLQGILRLELITHGFVVVIIADAFHEVGQQFQVRTLRLQRALHMIAHALAFVEEFLLTLSGTAHQLTSRQGMYATHDAVSIILRVYINIYGRIALALLQRRTAFERIGVDFNVGGD